jgi:uncharacterized membrane protein YhaH (DUF805 family)
VFRSSAALQSGSYEAAQLPVGPGVIEPPPPSLLAASAVLAAMILFFFCLAGARRGLRDMGAAALWWFLGTLIVVGVIAVGLVPNPLVGVAIGVGAAVVVTTIVAFNAEG